MKMNQFIPLKKIYAVPLVLIFSFLLSCAPAGEEDADASSGNCFSSGDILVANSASDVVLALNPDGSYKNIVFNVFNNSESVFGISMSAAGELLVAVEGADRIVAIEPSACGARTFTADANLNGTLRGITQVSNGDVLVVETNNVERFNSAGLRITTGGWPRALQTAGTGLSPTSTGGFVHCSTGTDAVRTYDNAGTQINTVVSGIAGTTDVMDCLAMSNGNIAAVFSGTTDTVRIYSSNLGSTVGSYSDISFLSTPGGIAQRANGNLLIVDRLLHYIVEVTNTGTFVNIIGDGVLNSPEFILVVP
jgi:hypothetical protein